jgi:hypothetical protein
MNSHTRTFASACGLSVAVCLIPVSPAAADPGGRHGDDRYSSDHYPGGHHRRGLHDHDAARAAVERGEIKPLAQLLDQIKDKLPGTIAGVEIERRAGAWLYEFRLIDKEGRLFDVHVDANSGEIVREKDD